MIREPTRRTARVRPVREILREYVGSEENRLVQFAAESLLDRNLQYNPLVFYGPTGTGKSFLALGLAERWRQQYPQDTVIVTCGPDFARSYANAVDTDNLSTFRKKSRSADLFVLDDVHLMQHKRAAQSELARAIDAVLQAGSAVLISDNTSTQCRRITTAGTAQPACRRPCRSR